MGPTLADSKATTDLVNIPPRQTGPNVWYGPQVASQESTWLFILTAQELAELEVAADRIVEDSAVSSSSSTLSLRLLSSLDNNFNLKNLRARIDSLVANNLNSGLGFFVWRGIPNEWSHARKCAAFLLIGKCIGNLRQQNGKGHVLGHVKDLGLDSSDPNVRVYQTRERQTFHTDSSDVVGLLCLRTAASGGHSSLVSSATVFNEMLATRPDLAHRLLLPMAKDRRGEIPSGCLPYFNIPVFHWYEGHLSAIYQRQYIDSAQRFPTAKRLTKEDVEALDLFDSLCDDERLNFTMVLAPGDLQFCNNHALLHDRTAFVDHPDDKRHLLRVWVAPEGARPLPPVYAERYSSIKVGDRGGVYVPGVEPVAPLHP